MSLNLSYESTFGLLKFLALSLFLSLNNLRISPRADPIFLGILGRTGKEV